MGLRLVPLFPFFLVNLVMGVTNIRVLTFFLVSQLGMLPATFLYVNAGEEVSKITSLQDIFTPGLLVAFFLLGLFPLVAKRAMAVAKGQRPYRPYSFRKPRSFDYDMLAIGGGAAGLVTCYIAAAVKAKGALVERHKMGGDCLNTGCVPSKALIKAAKMIHSARQGKKYGLGECRMEFDFAQVMERIQQVIKKIEPHDSVERYTQLGVDCYQGKAKIVSPWEVEVDGKRLSTRNITIATGATPLVPPIPGLTSVNYLVSDTLWNLRELPKKLVVLGGGPIGLEMAQSFQRLGSEVTVVEMASRLMAKEDSEVAEYLEQKLAGEGLGILTGHQAVEVKKGEGGHHQLFCQKVGHVNRGAGGDGNDGGRVVEFDQILLAVGRVPNTEGLAALELGIALNSGAGIAVNQYLQTNFPNIYACGDVLGGRYQFTHMAAHQAWYCAVNALFGKVKRFAVDYSAVPWATYTDPEVATVGQMEWELKENGTSYEVVKYDLNELDRAIIEGEDDGGFVKVCVVKGKDRILGATIVGPRASDWIMEFVMAIRHGLGLNKILATIHPYPTMAEANKYLAGQWRQQHRPEKVLGFLQEVFRRQRGGGHAKF